MSFHVCWLFRVVHIVVMNVCDLSWVGVGNVRLNRAVLHSYVPSSRLGACMLYSPDAKHRVLFVLLCL